MDTSSLCASVTAICSSSCSCSSSSTSNSSSSSSSLNTLNQNAILRLDFSTSLDQDYSNLEKKELCSLVQHLHQELDKRDSDLKRAAEYGQMLLERSIYLTDQLTHPTFQEEELMKRLNQTHQNEKELSLELKMCRKKLRSYEKQLQASEQAQLELENELQIQLDTLSSSHQQSKKRKYNDERESESEKREKEKGKIPEELLDSLMNQLYQIKHSHAFVQHQHQTLKQKWQQLQSDHETTLKLVETITQELEEKNQLLQVFLPLLETNTNIHPKELSISSSPRSPSLSSIQSTSHMLSSSITPEAIAEKRKTLLNEVESQRGHWANKFHQLQTQYQALNQRHQRQLSQVRRQLFISTSPSSSPTLSSSSSSSSSLYSKKYIERLESSLAQTRSELELLKNQTLSTVPPIQGPPKWCSVNVEPDELMLRIQIETLEQQVKSWHEKWQTSEFLRLEEQRKFTWLESTLEMKEKEVLKWKQAWAKALLKDEMSNLENETGNENEDEIKSSLKDFNESDEPSLNQDNVIVKAGTSIASISSSSSSPSSPTLDSVPLPLSPSPLPCTNTNDTNNHTDTSESASFLPYKVIVLKKNSPSPSDSKKKENHPKSDNCAQQ